MLDNSKKKEIRISMIQTGSPYDNAIAEWVNGILKTEFDLYQTFKSHSQASAAINPAIYKYNNLRLHASCNYLTPENTHNQQKVNQNKINQTQVNKYQEENITL
ncbi:integrase core domain-containing protein [Pedobacter suwonensis]